MNAALDMLEGAHITGIRGPMLLFWGWRRETSASRQVGLKAGPSFASTQPVLAVEYWVLLPSNRSLESHFRG